MSAVQALCQLFVTQVNLPIRSLTEAHYELHNSSSEFMLADSAERISSSHQLEQARSLILNTPLRCICLLSTLLTGCSSDSDNPIEPVDPTQDDSIQNEQTTVIDAGNYESILKASMDVLRSDVYHRADLLIKEIETLWRLDAYAEVGQTLVYACEEGGTVSRTVSQQPDLDENRRIANLDLNDCVTDDVTLNGTVGIDDLAASFTALGDSSRTLTLELNELTLEQPGSSETITGTYEQYTDNMISYVKNTATTLLYQKTEGGNSASLSNAIYQHQFRYIYETDPEDSNLELIRWEYSETGNGTLSISALGLSNAYLLIEPELIYINKPEEQITNYTDTMSSGELELSVPAGGQLTVSEASVENNTVLYTLTDTEGQQTTIEREWLSPAPL